LDRSSSRIGNRSIASEQTPVKTDNSIAVLPFDDLSSPENASFAEGLSRELVTQLTKAGKVRVVPSIDAGQFNALGRNVRQTGQKTGAAYLVLGSVQRAENQIRVHVQLIDANADKTIWAETYDRKLTDLFVIESEIAKSVADHVRAAMKT
jgi:TolB-like protein